MFAALRRKVETLQTFPYFSHIDTKTMSLLACGFADRMYPARTVLYRQATKPHSELDNVQFVRTGYCSVITDSSYDPDEKGSTASSDIVKCNQVRPAASSRQQGRGGGTREHAHICTSGISGLLDC